MDSVSLRPPSELPRPDSGYALYCDLRKSMGVISAAIEAFKITHGASKLVASAPTQDQTFEAILVYRAYKEAKELSSLESSITHLLTRIKGFSAQYSPCFPQGFNKKLIAFHTLKLFLLHGRKTPYSKTMIEAIAASFKAQGIRLSFQRLQNAYAQDEGCQKTALGHLSRLYKTIYSLEEKPTTSLRTRQLKAISLLETRITTLEAAYHQIAAKVEMALETDEPFTDQENQDWAHYEKVHSRLLKAKVDYDTAVDYSLYLDQYVFAIQGSLSQINHLKDQFADYQAPFLYKTRMARSETHLEILHLTPRPRLDDPASPGRLPSLGNLNQVATALIEAIKEEAQPVLASRLYYRLANYQSPIPGHSNALEALFSLIEDEDPSQIFPSYFIEPTETHKSLIIKALRRLT